MGALKTFTTAVRADHDAMKSTRERYPTEGSSMATGGLARDAVQKIGLQMLVAIRMMRLLRDSKVPFGGQIAARMIRHLYGAEIHWDAEIAPGVNIVHGNGLVISHAAVVGPGCVLFQNVTLGESIDPDTRTVGAPTLERDVHVMPGAVLLGPITVGAGSKIMANAVLDRSVPPRSIVRGPVAEVADRNHRLHEPTGTTFAEAGEHAPVLETRIEQ